MSNVCPLSAIVHPPVHIRACIWSACGIEVPLGEERQQSEPYISTIRIAFDNSWSESLVSGSEIVHMHVRTFCHVLFHAMVVECACLST